MNILKSISFFICLLLLSRLIPHPPNFTPIIAGIIFLPFMIGDKRMVLFIPILIMFISDLIIGFHNHMIWTYTSFLLISLGVVLYFKKPFKNIFFLSILSPSLFFLLTNFGVWLTSSFYTKDIFYKTSL